MLHLYEQKILIEYLINAIEKIKLDSEGSLNIQKILDFIETVQKNFQCKKINFNLEKNIDCNLDKQTKKTIYAIADDVVFQLKEQLKKFKNIKISPREKTFRAIEKLFNLSKDEINIFKMFCRNEIDNICCDILCLAHDCYGHCNVLNMCRYYLGINKPQKCIEKLVDAGILLNIRGRRGFKYSLPSKIDEAIERKYSSVNKMCAHFVGSALGANLKKNDFEHLKNEFETVELILKSALEQKTKGVNILFYGEVGAGKTEMAKVVAKCLKTPLFEILCEDDDNNEMCREERIGNLKLKLGIFVNLVGKKIILFDEAEDVFKDTMFDRRTQSKAYVNKILEENETPIIWTTNDIENMDKAYLRRFVYSVKFEKLSEDVQLNFMKKEFKKHNFEISDDEIMKLSKKYDLASSVITNSIKILRLTNSPKEDFEKFVKNQITLLNRGKETSENFDVNKKTDNYNFDLINTDNNMEDLAKKIKNTGKLNFSLCLYGEAGTGKSEYAKQLANMLELGVVFKKASDLMSKWVGETERNIAKAFKEARDKKAILIFDEADSFLQSRENAQRSWEISQVNEMLTWMESHPYPFICTTNFMDSLDEASLRRFTFKIKFKYMTTKQVQLGFKHFFNKDVSEKIASINGLTAGDFATVKKKIAFLGTEDVCELKQMLEEEVKVKKSKELSSNIGF
ncbi:MAG: ATP-binding protein [Candidatus Gastranaerophilales bacterium]|nr:ATP-binding protein [Candidatus Gastranaerophilales bacterium]